MKILFIGDSIVKGTQGVDWVKMIAKKHPEWKIDNAGVNGETLNRIADRAVVKLAQSDYDLVVFQAGYNDIMLPTFETRQGWFSKSYHHQLKLGNSPATIGDFEMLLRESVDYIKSVTKANVVLLNLSCINEDLNTETNKKVNTYNQVIRKIAREYNCGLADIGQHFSNYLNKVETQDYLLENFINTAFLDSINCILGRADQLSESRNLHLTIDGVHLNSKGAAIFKEEVEKLLISFDEKVPLYI